MKKTTLFLLSMLLYLFSDGQRKPQNMAPPTVFTSFNFEQLKGGWIKYKIDPKIKDSISKTILEYGMPGQLMKESLNKHTRNTESMNTFSSYVNYVAGNTSNIILTNPNGGIMGYRIIIIGDSCKVFFYGTDNTDPDGWAKYHENDKAYREEILVLPKAYSLTLTKKPAFVAGEIISGYIEFESQPFYQKASSGYAQEMQLDLKGYFKTFDLKHSKLAQGLPKWMLQ